MTYYSPQYGRTSAPQAQWMPMYQQHPSHHADDDDGTYKPAAISQSLEVDNEGTPTYLKQSFAQKYFGGLRRTLRAFAITGTLVLAVNVAWLLHAKSKYGIVDGFGTIKSGECSSIKSLNTWFHLLINVLSTLLLTGSNAFMAAYSGPTRHEVDNAHARRKWLHVGTISLRNMMGISWTKSLVVLILALSSIPFHLLYNSLVFAELAVNNYNWAVTTEDFLTGANFSFVSAAAGTFTSSSALQDQDNELMQTYRNMQTAAPTWEPLDQKACIEAYSDSFVTERRNLVIVSSEKNSSNSILYSDIAELEGSSYDNNWWICSLSGNDGGNLKCNPQDYIAKATSWKVFGHPVKYCLSERITNHGCSVQFNLQIMLVVVAFNAVKVIVMFWVLFRLDTQNLLACVGDAAASFIRQPDQTSTGICLADRRHINSYWFNPGPRVYNGGGTRRRWGSAISGTRWTLFTLLMLFAWGIVFIFTIWGFSNIKSRGVALTPSGLSSLGFGTLSQHALAFAGAADISVIALSVIANVPQIFLALIYLMYMGVMTAMFNAVDWARFGKVPQTLMVSSPTGHQRGTWLLGAPIAYGLSLLALQTLLHWFVSQSLFVVNLVVLNPDGTRYIFDGYSGNYDPRYLTNLGYSPIAIICTIVASGILYLTAIVFMLWKIPLGTSPVVSTCSAAISAACHVPREMLSDAIIFEKLGWGATGDAPNGVGHCSLGPANVFEAGVGHAGSPIMGKAYAGVEENDHARMRQRERIR